MNAQAAAFVAVIVLLAITLAAASPLAAMGLGAASVLALPIIGIRAALRSRAAGAFSLTPAERALGLSVLILAVTAGATLTYITAMVGIRGEYHFPALFHPAMRPPADAAWRSMHYEDPAMQAKLKEELAKAGIPFTARVQDGKEWVRWGAQDDAAAERIHRRISEGPLPSGRNVHFPDAALRKQFVEWLGRKGIEARLVEAYGKEHVVWAEGAGDGDSLLEQFIRETHSDCPRKKREC